MSRPEEVPLRASRATVGVRRIATSWPDWSLAANTMPRSVSASRRLMVYPTAASRAWAEAEPPPGRPPSGAEGRFTLEHTLALEVAASVRW